MKICLIGSTRFMPLYIETNRRLSVAGHIVYTVAQVSSESALTKSELSAKDKEVLDLVHLRKILESDVVVLVTDETGYFGESTGRELLWAQINGKKIFSCRDKIKPAIDRGIFG